MQPGIETWSINITREIFFFENYTENEAVRVVPGVFIFYKLVFPPYSAHEFSRKMFLSYSHSLIDFTSLDIGQYVL